MPLGDHFWSRQSDEFSGTMRTGKHNGRYFEAAAFLVDELDASAYSNAF